MSALEAVTGIRRLVADFSGALGVWARALPSGNVIQWNAQEVFPAASTLKLPILYEVYRQAGEGRFRLTDTRPVRAEDVVAGSGILKDLTPGITFSIRDLATLMIIVSDNTAANLMIDLVGMDSVNRSLRDLGFRSTVLTHKFMHEAPDGSVNRSSPADLGQLLAQIASHALLTPSACDEMLRIMRQQHYTDMITRRIPAFDGFVEAGTAPAVTVASKSGSVRGTRNDVALVESPTCRYVIAMMSRGCADRRFYVDNEAAVLLADISALVYAHYCSVPTPPHDDQHPPKGRTRRKRR